MCKTPAAIALPQSRFPDDTPDSHGAKRGAAAAVKQVFERQMWPGVLDAAELRQRPPLRQAGLLATNSA